jgi:hypothetical protein
MRNCSAARRLCKNFIQSPRITESCACQLSGTLAGSRISNLQKLYGLLGSLAERVGGARTLATCSGRLEWPRRGVYFFMEDGEVRSDSGTGPRIVRVGTHALTEGSGTKLWTRLSQHRGQTKKTPALRDIMLLMNIPILPRNGALG